MAFLASKILKPGGEKLDKFEEQLVEALRELETNAEIKPILKEVYFTGAKELDAAGKKSIIIYVPVPLQKQFQRIQVRLGRELEKKFSGRPVVFIAQRRILPRPKRKQRTQQKQLRPRSRTLTAVHEGILSDLVFPAEIVGKRTRVKLDGSKLIKIHLDKSQQTTLEHKLEVFTAIYLKLTGKNVTFEFPAYE